MPKLPSIRPAKIIKILQKEGFTSRPGQGSHMVFKHPDGRRTVVSFHRKPIAVGTLNAILKQAEIPKDKFLKLFRKK